MPTLLRSGGADHTTPGGTPDVPSGGGDDPSAAGQHVQCPACKGRGIQNQTFCPRCEGSGVIPGNAPSAAEMQESVGQLVKLAPLTNGVRPHRLREAEGNEGQTVYEVEILTEGLGNAKDRVFYTAAALREAVSNGIFTGMQAYANHPDSDEERTRPERDVRQLVGYYRGFKFQESGSEGKPTVKAELVVNKGMTWMTDLLESAIAAKSDGVELCGISIDGGGLVELGEIDGKYTNICRQITEAPSADIVTRAARGGKIVSRLRESVQRTQLAQPQETPMKLADFTSKVTATHVKLRESLAEIVKPDATEDAVSTALTGLKDGVAELETLAGTQVEPEVKFREAQAGDQTATALAAELETTKVKLREAEAANTTLTTEKTTLERGMFAAQALREAEVPKEQSQLLFPELMKLDSLDAMKGHIDSRKAYEDQLLVRLQESMGIGVMPQSLIEGAAPRIPAGANTAGSGAKERLQSFGIPVKAEPAAAAA
jgi:hypothetical protein